MPATDQPSFPPRGWKQRADDFGVAGSPWRDANTPWQAAELRAAQWQERVSLNLRGAIAGAGLTQEAFANSAGLSRWQVSRFIRGYVWLNLRQIAMLEQALNVDLTTGARPELVRVGRVGTSDRVRA